MFSRAVGRVAPVDERHRAGPTGATRNVSSRQPREKPLGQMISTDAHAVRVYHTVGWSPLPVAAETPRHRRARRKIQWHGAAARKAASLRRAL